MIKTLLTAAMLAVFTIGAAPVGADAAAPKASSSFFAKKKIAVVKTKKSKVAVKKSKVVRTQSIFAATSVPPKQKIKITRSCGSFSQCLFGRRTASARTGVVRNGVRFERNRVASASIFSSRSSLSGRQTRRPVDWNTGKYAVGSLVVKTPERALYLVTGPGEAIRYSVGVGKEGFQWGGTARISAKKEWPSWTPPQEMIEREAEKGRIIPDFMEGGPGNPLGARALYIGGTIFRVHGTNNEASIGGAVSSGCIRMMNADVIDLYNRVKVGSRIYVYQ